MAKVRVTMIALDTNVPVRFLVQDNFQQTAQTNAVFANLTAECHGLAVLRGYGGAGLGSGTGLRAFGLPRTDIAGALDGLLSAQKMVVKHPDRVGLAVERYR